MSPRVAWSALVFVPLVVIAASFARPAHRRSVRWSDPAAWRGHVPKAGEDAVIAKGVTVILDTNPPPLRRLTVNGALQFADRDLTLRAASITVAGRLQIGTAAHPFQHRAVVELTGPRPDPNDSNAPNKALMADGGVLEIHGKPVTKTWNRLAQNAEAGSASIALSGAADWPAGARIVIASTDFDMHQAEERTVTAVSGNRLSLDKPLRYRHWGTVTDGVPEQAEVGLLTRNVVVRGDPASASDAYGGQILILRGSQARISDVEVTRMGQQGRLGCYPIHFHRVGDISGSRVTGCAIHDCYNRALTIHGTNGLVVADNVCDGTFGHAFFLEDGIEEHNTLSGNLALGIRVPPADRTILATDKTPAAFWITNPANAVTGNVAAGSEGQGFWLALAKHPTGPSRTAETDKRIWPRRLPLGKFDGNVSHSNERDGLNVDGPPNPPGETGAPTYDPPAPLPNTSPKERGKSSDFRAMDAPIQVGATFSGLTSYKNRRHGVWMRGSHLLLTNALLADNSIGATLAGSECAVTHSRFVGESGNLGTPAPGDPRGANGRSLPKPAEAGFPIRGFEFYDGLVCARDVAFANFEPSSVRHAGAISYLRFSPFFVDPRNWIAHATFDNCNRVWLDAMSNAGAAEYGGDGYRSAVFMDRDGSVTGAPGASVAVRNALLADSQARLRRDWNAYVTPAPFGRLFVDTQEKVAKVHAPVRISRVDEGGVAAMPHMSVKPQGKRSERIGQDVALWGAPADGPKTSFQSTVIADRAYRIAFSNGVPDKVRLTLRHREPGDYADIVLPATGKVLVYEAGHRAAPIQPIAPAMGLAGAKQSAYVAAAGKTVIRLVVPPAKTQETIIVERAPGPAAALAIGQTSRFSARG